MKLKLKKILLESMPNAEGNGDRSNLRPPQMTKEQKSKILDMISKYNEYGKSIYAEHDPMEVARTLSEIANGVESFLCNESDHWFDEVTIKKNTAGLKKYVQEFAKIAQESKAHQQRLAAVYEDVGHVLGRYFKIEEMADETLPGKPTITQTTPRKSMKEGSEPLEEELLEGANFIRSNTYLTTIANPRHNAQAAEILKNLKMALSNKYRFSLEGRNPDRKSLAAQLGRSHASLKSNIPLENATTVDVYIFPKDGSYPNAQPYPERQ